jgi:hypothetical protein
MSKDLFRSGRCRNGKRPECLPSKEGRRQMSPTARKGRSSRRKATCLAQTGSSGCANRADGSRDAQDGLASLSSGALVSSRSRVSKPSSREERPMADTPVAVTKFETKSHNSPDEVRTPNKTRVEVVRLPGYTLGRSVVGTDSCQVSHVGHAVSGRLTVRLNDGTQKTFEPRCHYDVRASLRDCRKTG